MASTGDSRYAPPTAGVADVAPAQGSPILASRWRRLGGSILDGLIVLAAVLLVTRLAHWNPFDPAARGKTSLISLAVFLLLNGYLLVARGQTIAKAALGMRIVRPDRGKVSAFRILGLRYGVGYLVNLSPAAGPLIGLLSVLDPLPIFLESRRCLHDLIADTIVIRD